MATSDNSFEAERGIREGDGMFGIEEFPETGIVHLPGALTRDEAVAIRERIWRFIESRSDIRANDPASWGDRRSPGLSFKPLQGRPVFGPFVENDQLQSALERIFGTGGWETPKRRGRVLLTFPRPGVWVMPSGWHMDGNFVAAADRVPELQLWALLDDLEPTGGGTLLLAGSHRLVQRYATKLPPDARGGNSVSWGRFMKQHPWLNELRRGGTPDRPRRDLLNEQHEIDGVEMRVIEISGSAGDMFVSDLQVFHSGSPNTAGRTRQMLTGGIKGEANRKPIYNDIHPAFASN